MPTLLLLLVVLSALLRSPAAHAQAQSSDGGAASPPGADDSDPNQITPPKLIGFVDAGYSDEARAAGVMSGSVTLVITIGSDGSVEDVKLSSTPAGYGFDELAMSAARRFVFEPAKKGGAPMRSRIQYRYEFTLSEPEPPAPAPEPAAAATPAPGSIELTVLDAEAGKPLDKAEILLTSPTDPTLAIRLITDARGRAKREALPPGSYELRTTLKGFGDEVHNEEIVSGQITEIAYRLSELHNYEEYGAVARVKAPPREVTRRTIEREVLTRVAGTRGDALRTIELLPGVSRPPFGSGLVLIRGSSPQDSSVLLDGAPVPLLYHFGGLTSFINSRALERIDFFPGNFSVKYGRRTGGIIDVGTRDPRSDGYHGVVDVNLPLDSSLLVEGPITEKASFLVAGRRSYFGELATLTIPSGTFDAFAAPVYNDYQLFVVYRPTDHDRLRLSVYGSSDRLEVLFADAPDDAPSIRGIELGQRFDRQQLGWTHQYSSKLDHNIELSNGRANNHFKAGPDLYFSLLTNEVYLRGELRYRPTQNLTLILGTDSLMSWFEVSYAGPVGDGDEGDAGGGSLESREQIRLRQDGFGYRPSLYLEAAWQATKQLRFVPGFRVDYNDQNQRFTYDPRLSTTFALTEKTRLKAGVGLFSQPPQPQEAATGIGNPKLLSTRAVHYGLGADHNFTDDFSLGVEGFYKQIYDRVIASETGDPPYTNDGKGRIYGLEVAGRKQASGRWFGFLSYTLMKSERKEPGAPWRPFDYDQRHILTLSSGVRLGKGWEAGATLRVVTGNPRTPYTNVAPYSHDGGQYFPEYGRINSARSPTFHRLDVRVEKQWTFAAWRLAWYLDVQNIYNSKNPETTVYSFDYAQSGLIRGLPILPIIGLRGEL